MSKLLAVLLAACLAACGMKGPLVLPPGPAPEPLLGKSKTAENTAGTPPATGDLSTTQKP